MNQSEEREIAELRDRLSRLTEASLRINESLDFDTVLQGVLDSARSLTEARSSVITLLDDSGRIADFLSSGMTAEEAGLLWEMPDGMRLFEYLGSAREPLRLRDLLGHDRAGGRRDGDYLPSVNRCMYGVLCVSGRNTARLPNQARHTAPAAIEEVGSEMPWTLLPADICSSFLVCECTVGR